MSSFLMTNQLDIRAKSPRLWALAALLLAGLCIRVYFLQLHVVVIEGEGSGYAHQAENLVNGRGFESYLYAGPDLEHCWLQPVLIAAISLISHNLDSAVHIVSLASGTLVILWAFLLANRCYGSWAAWIAAIIATFHPLLVALSTTGYAESLAMALQLGAIYWSIRLIENEGRWPWLFGGCLWGLAYLNRTECLILPAATLGVYLVRVIWTRASFGQWARQSSLLLLVFAFFVSPYALLFYHSTGKVRFEGKNLLNYTIGQRELEGMSMDVAERELTPSLVEAGPSLNNYAYTAYSPYPSHFRDLVSYFVRMARRNCRWVLHNVVSAPYLGAWPLTSLAFIGFVWTPWNAVRVFREFYLVGFCAYLIILLLASHIEVRRYVFPLLPFLLLWASAGIARIMRAIQWTAGHFKAHRRVGTWVATVATMCLAGFILRAPAKTINGMWEFTSGWAPNNDQKEAGNWLHSVAPGLKATYGTPVFCYYADSFEWIWPYTDSETALRYLHVKNPDYIFLDSGYSGYTPYYDDWLDAGIPDRAASVIYQKEFPSGRKVLIYRWNHGPEKPLS
jgi:4-amino-4-deoxy-L-arabinose transferase-like glycosyltransferase